MAMIFRSSEEKRQEVFADAEVGELPRQLWQEIVYFGAMIGFLIFANWAKPMGDMGFAMAVYQVKWWLSGAFLALTLYTSFAWFSTEERKDWLESTWTFTKQIIPLLLGGVLLAGFLLGRPGLDAGIIPDHYIADLVGGNSLGANFFAAISGAFMYFATLTEVPILQGLIGSGMGKGPALSLLLAGPALSLPAMIVLRQIMGTKMMVTYVSIVVAPFDNCRVCVWHDVNHETNKISGRNSIMKKIAILGPGCANCKKLEANTREALASLGMEAEVVKNHGYE